MSAKEKTYFYAKAAFSAANIALLKLILLNAVLECPKRNA